MHSPPLPCVPPVVRCSVGGITFDGKMQLLAFCLFEVMVGVFWPSMMTMRRWAVRGGVLSVCF